MKISQRKHWEKWWLMPFATTISDFKTKSGLRVNSASSNLYSSQEIPVHHLQLIRSTDAPTSHLAQIIIEMGHPQVLHFRSSFCSDCEYLPKDDYDAFCWLLWLCSTTEFRCLEISRLATTKKVPISSIIDRPRNEDELRRSTCLVSIRPNVLRPLLTDTGVISGDNLCEDMKMKSLLRRDVCVPSFVSSVVDHPHSFTNKSRSGALTTDASSWVSRKLKRSVVSLAGMSGDVARPEIIMRRDESSK